MPAVATKKTIELDLAKSRLVTNSEPALTEFGNLRTCQNMRPVPGGFQAVGGMTKINTTVLAAKMRAGCHFKKDYPNPESHILIQGTDGADTVSAVFDNVTAVPNQGNFSATSIFTDSVVGIGRFNPTVDGSLLYHNEAETRVWGGLEYRCGAFIVGNTANTVAYDFTTEVNNSLTDATNIATLHRDSTSVILYVGSTRALQTIKLYLGSVINTNAGTTLTLETWTGSAWTAKTVTADGTVSGGKKMAQTGSITFASTVGVSKLYTFQGQPLYWYRLTWATIDAAITVTQCTTNAPFQIPTDIWDGDPRVLLGFYKKLSSTNTQDYTTNVAEDSYDKDVTATYANLGDIGNEITDKDASDGVIVYSLERLMGVSFQIPDDKGNTAASVCSVYTWNGASLQLLTGIVDNTSEGGKSLRQSGTITWTPSDDNIEKKRMVNDTALFCYKFVFSVSLNTTRVNYATGITAPKKIRHFSFSITWQKRIVLVCEVSGRKNLVMIGGEDSTSILNGSDAWEQEIGKNELISAGVMFLRYGSTVQEILVLCNRTTTFIIEGVDPSDFTVKQVTGDYGCVAYETMKNIDLGGLTVEKSNRNALCWESASGLVLFDGSSVIPFPSDVDDKFDPKYSTHIFSSMIARGYSFYDSFYKGLHFLYADGSSTTLNKESVFSLSERKFYTFKRTGKELQGAFPVTDTLGNKYLYGFTNDGYLHRLEYGTSFDGVAIDQDIRFCDKPFGDSLLHRTKIEQIRLFAKSKNTTTAKLKFDHYADLKTAVTTSVSKQIPLGNVEGDLVTYFATLDVPWSYYHSLRLRLSTTNETIGFEPYHISLLVSEESSP